jgi:hypothetical protein
MTGSSTKLANSIQNWTFLVENIQSDQYNPETGPILITLFLSHEIGFCG